MDFAVGVALKMVSEGPLRSKASIFFDVLSFICVLGCDVMLNEHTKCPQRSCSQFMVAYTSTLTECIHICLNRVLCTHYIWHKLEKTCWVVEGEGSDVYRDRDMNTITGSCGGGNSSIRKQLLMLPCDILPYVSCTSLIVIRFLR